jgi:biotin synthase-related radical SAM superfamily protein
MLAPCVQEVAFVRPMLKAQMGRWGNEMGQANVDRAKTLAQNLMEILTSYEEELMALERETPAMGQLRRAVGITIAEACYLITDQGFVQTTWAPPTDGRASPAS